MELTRRVGSFWWWKSPGLSFNHSCSDCHEGEQDATPLNRLLGGTFEHPTDKNISNGTQSGFGTRRFRV